MQGNSLFFRVFGLAILAIVSVNLNSHVYTALGINKTEKVDIASYNGQNGPKKDNLIGTYIVQDDKFSKLDVKEDGSYSLTINVCEKYIELAGKYEIRDTKLKLINNEYSYEDLNGNEELTFSIVDEKTLRADESLVCVPQETLFEK